MTQARTTTDGQGAGGTVFLCPGQGSQKPGMGADLLGDPTIARTVDCASAVFARDMGALLADADPHALDDPRAAQAAIVTLTVAIGRALIERGVEPCVIAGFSLGQMSALALADMISDEDAFALVDVRARIICDTAAENPGAMSALLKASEDEARALCARCADGEVLVPANFNCPGQIVISGFAPSNEPKNRGVRTAAGPHGSRRRAASTPL